MIYLLTAYFWIIICIYELKTPLLFRDKRLKLKSCEGKMSSKLYYQKTNTMGAWEPQTPFLDFKGAITWFYLESEVTIKSDDLPENF